MAGVSAVRVPQAMTGPAHLTVLDKQQPYLIIQTRVILSVPAREVAFKDLCHFIALGNHAQLRNPLGSCRSSPAGEVLGLVTLKTWGTR